jgi:hypothetical protein
MPLDSAWQEAGTSYSSTTGVVYLAPLCVYGSTWLSRGGSVQVTQGCGAETWLSRQAWRAEVKGSIYNSKLTVLDVSNRRSCSDRYIAVSLKPLGFQLT